MRIALAVLAAVASALVGRSIALGCARRTAVIREAMDAIQLLRIHMLERLLPLHAALEKSQFEPFRLVGRKLLTGDGALAAWRAVLPLLTRRGATLDCLTEEDLSLLFRFFEGLGTSTRLEQEALISATLAEMGRLESEAGKMGAEKGRLYTTLGLLGGLALAIVFV